MKRNMFALVLAAGGFAAFLSGVAQAEVDTIDSSDCSSKYQRPIAVASGNGDVVYMNVNTRTKLCTGLAITDPLYAHFGEGGNTGSQSEASSDNGSDHGDTGGDTGGETGGEGGPK